MHNRTLMLRRLSMAVVLGLIALASAAQAQWSAITDLPLSRTFAMSAASDSKVWLFGGAQTGQLGPTGIPTSNSAQAWSRNVSGGAWNTIAAMPTARAAGFAAYINNKIYIVGGVHVENNSVVVDGAALEYDPANNSYATKATMPTPVFGFAGAVVGGKIYVIGGVSTSGSNYVFPTAVQIYDPATDTWSSSSIDAPYSAVYPSATAVGENIYLVGGVNTSTFTSRNSAYKGTVGPTGVTWTTIANYPQAVSGHGGGTLDGIPYFAGGQGDNGAAMRNVYYYDNASSSWKGTYWLPRGLVHAAALPSDGASIYYLSTSDGIPTPYKFAKGPMDVAVAETAPASIIVSAQTGQGAQATFNVTNSGVAALTGNITTPAGDTWLSVSGATTLNITAGNTEQYLVTINAGALTEGSYTSTITVNTNDPDHSVVTIPVKVYVRDQFVQQPTRVVMEESSGAWCGPCGAYGVPEVKRLADKYGESLIPIALHDRGGRGATADTLATTNTEDLGNLLKVQAFPNASVGRYTFSGNSGPMMGLESWDGAIQAVLDNVPNAPVAMDIKSYKWDNNTRTVRATIELTTATALNLGTNTLNVTGVLLEDSIKYSQNGQSDPFYHVHVARDFWPSITGQVVTIPAEANDDGVIPPGSKLTVNVVFTPVKFARASKCHMVFFTHVNNGPSNLGPILQGTEIGLTESVDSGSGGNVSFDTPSNTISVVEGSEAVLTTTVTNSTAAPVELTLTRTDNSIPSGWTSLFCLNGQCTTIPTSDGPVTYTVPPGQSTQVSVKVMPSSAGTGTVTLRVKTGNDNQTHDETYTVTATQGQNGVVDAVVGNAMMTVAANTPNPASDLTTFAITLARPTAVAIDVIAMDGTTVLQIPASIHGGTYNQVLNVAGLPAGTYNVRFSAGGQGVMRTINVVR